MGWSTSAPTLPSGSSWAQQGTTTWENNHIRITSIVYVARLADNGIAVKITETRTQIGTYWLTDNYMRVDIGGTTGAAYTTAWSANSGTAKSIYYTGTADAGVTVDVKVGYREDTSASIKTVSFTAPALLGPSVYVKINGSWQKASAVYVKSAGAWKVGQLKVKTGGEWK